MKLKKYTCPYCGADIKVDFQEKRAKCDYCDSELFFEGADPAREEKSNEKKDAAEQPESEYSESGVLKGRVVNPYKTVIIKGGSTEQPDKITKRNVKKESSHTVVKIIGIFLILCFVSALGTSLDQSTSSSNRKSSSDVTTTEAKSEESSETTTRTETLADIEYTLDNTLVQVSSDVSEDNKYIQKTYTDNNRALLIRFEPADTFFIDLSKDENLDKLAEVFFSAYKIDPSYMLSKSIYKVDQTDAMLLQLEQPISLDNGTSEIKETDYCVIITENGFCISCYVGPVDSNIIADFKKILDGIKIINPVSEAASDTNNSSSKNIEDGAVSASFKKLMDSYEAYFDKLLEFQADGEEISIYKAYDFLGDALTYMEVIDQLNAIDTDSLTEAEQDYYKEVLGRISIKMLKFAFFDNEE